MSTKVHQEVNVRTVGSPYVRESTKVDPGFRSQPLDPSIWILDFNTLHSGFQPSEFRIPYLSGFRIPTARICWIPDSGFSYVGRVGGMDMTPWESEFCVRVKREKKNQGQVAKLLTIDK